MIFRDTQVRAIDPYIITYMDEYAMLLKAKSDQAKLNKLVHDLLNIDPARAEVFVALSVMWERKDERRALAYAEKVGLTDYDVLQFDFSRFLTRFSLTSCRALELMIGT